MTAPRDHVADLGRLWEWFAAPAARGYSPIYEDIAHWVARDRDVLSLVREAPPTAHDPLVLLAAVHYLILGGLDHPLAEVYGGRSQDRAGPLFCELCLDHRVEVLDVMATRRVQTNEVGRSAVIGPALTWVARRHGGPLRVVDVGSSAGLNLLCDRYLLDYGEFGTTGAPDSPLRIECRVASGTPPIVSRLPSIAWRMGIDLDPPDLRDGDDVRWLLACTWPDTGRLARTQRAIDIARRDPPLVVRGDALGTLPEVLAAPGSGVVCVITTWALAYLSPPQRRHFVEILSEFAARREVVWVACEGPGVVDLAETGALPDHGSDASIMTVVEFDGVGPTPTLLGFVHPHGRWIDWRA